MPKGDKGFALEKFRKKVKAKQRAHPGMSYSQAQQSVKRDNKSGAVGRVKTKKKAKTKKRMPRKRTKAAPAKKRKAPTVSYHKKKAKQAVEEKLARNFIQSLNAKNKTQRKKLRKKAVPLRQELRKLC